MPLTKKQLTGLFTAIVTPLRDDGAVDVKALQALVRFQLEAGASGIVPIGGTGEYPAFSRDERRTIVAACVESAQGKPVIPGVLSTGFEDALEAGRDFAAAGAAAVMTVTPYYAPGTRAGMRSYHALRLSPGAVAAAQVADRGHQVERAAPRHGDVGRDRARNRRRVRRRHLGQMLVDAMTMRMVMRPQSLDTIVATNLHADILSDLAAALAGSLGIAPTANLNPERTFPSMFEPIHGSAFDIMGKGVANPVGTFWSAVMMLEHLGEKPAAERLMRAIERVTADKRFHTPDLGGTARTADVTAAVIDAIQGANA